MPVFKHRSYGTGFGVAVFLCLATPAFSQVQSQTTPPASTPPQGTQSQGQTGGNVSDTATVSIFAQKRALYGQGFTRISSSSGSSCEFMNDYGDTDVTDSYLSDMGYSSSFIMNNSSGDDVGGTSGSYSSGRQRIRVNAPFGDASNSRPFTPSTAPGGCTAADASIAAGRAYIASHDTTLKDAFAAYDAKDFPKALGLFEKAYSKVSGREIAAVILAQMYFDGLGTGKNIEKSLYWYKKAAEAPFKRPRQLRFDPAHPNNMNPQIEACMSLAQIYMRGYQVAQNPTEARKWFLLAAEHGYVPAIHLAGRVYQSGYGGDKNIPKAISYFKSAGEVSYAPSQYQLGQLYYFGAEGVPADKTKAGAWLKLAAKAGYPDALYAVGRMYDLGEGGAAVDPARALVYYKEAAIKGQVEAQTTLATYLYTGDGVPQDLDGARKLFDQAAKQGDAEAMFNLGVMWCNGEGGPRDRAIAYVWFKLAAESGLDKGNAAVAELEPKLTADERAAADAVLNPKPGSK